MRIEKKIFALGFFDGVHLGHQALLEQCVELARRLNATPAAITFDRHPQSLFTSTPPGLINSNADRDALLCRFGQVPDPTDLLKPSPTILPPPVYYRRHQPLSH